MNENELAKPQQNNIVVSPEDLPDLDSMEEGLPVQAQYMEFTAEGETERGILCGWSEMASKQGGHPIPVAMWQNARGIFANAGANLTQQLQRVNLGQAIQITFKGAVKTKSGNNCKTFEVRLLTPKGQKQDVASVPVTKPVERKENVLDRGRVPISKDVPEEHQEFDPTDDDGPTGDIGPPPDEMSKDGNTATITMNKTNLLGGTTKDGKIWWGVELPNERPSVTWKTSDGNLLTSAAQQNKRVLLTLDPVARKDGGRNILAVKVL